MFDRVGNVVGSGVVIMAVSLLRVCDCICLCLDKRVVFFCAIFLPLFLMLLKSSFFFLRGGQTTAKISGQMYCTIWEKANYLYASTHPNGIQVKM